MLLPWVGPNLVHDHFGGEFQMALNKGEILCYNHIRAMEFSIWHERFTKGHKPSREHKCNNCHPHITSPDGTNVESWEWWAEFRLPETFPVGVYAIGSHGNYTVYENDVPVLNTNWPWEHTRDVRNGPLLIESIKDGRIPW